MKETLKKQRLFFISLIGIVVVSLIMGTTFAYQTIIVDNEEQRKVELVSDTLKVTYTNTKIINIEDMPLLPSYRYSDNYTEFTINATESTKDVAFKLDLVELSYSKSLVTEDFRYTLVEVVDGKENVATEGNFSTLSNTEFEITDYITLSNDTQNGKTYRLYLWIKETTSDQNHLEKNNFQGKVSVSSVFKDLKLSNIIMNDSRITKNEGVPFFDRIEEEEVGMFSAEDDYGTSWYFRGKQSYNYVKFAGFTWRIVRINGDGSVRMILHGSLDTVKREGETAYAGATSAFVNNDVDDNAQVGYMYGTTGISTSYDEAHANNYDSQAKITVDKFYTDYIENEEKGYHYGSYLSDTLFCADKSLSLDNYDKNSYGFGSLYTEYAIKYRMNSPTLECAKGENNTYSRYTVNSSITTKGVSVNNDLDYPIALLTADEHIMAGGWDESNTSYFLNTEETTWNNWWTMTPYEYGVAFPAQIQYIDYTGYIATGSFDAYQSFRIRPVINLRSDVTIKSDGLGTKENPYEIQ